MTRLAFVHTILAVCTCVFPQVGGARKLPAAHDALVRPLPCVQVQGRLQVTGLCEARVAHVALVMLVAGV